MEGVCALKNVRLFYKKSGLLRFASHLDMNRVMTRLLRMSKVPIWYTEGFNRHPYITFALPLSLGFTSDYEVMDFRFDEDDFSLEMAQNLISAVCPKGIEVLSLKEPVFKTGKIAFADFDITFEDFSENDIELLNNFLNQKEILVSKKTKRGNIKEMNLAEKINLYKVSAEGKDAVLTLRLPAGGEDNVNPKILVDKFLEDIDKNDAIYSVCRKMLLLADGTKFE